MDSINPNSPAFHEHSELVHYTTDRGLEGILGTNSLWATDIQHLNDLQEQHLFYDHLLPELASVPLNHAIEQLKHRPDFRRLIKKEGTAGARKYLFDKTQGFISDFS